MTRDKQTAGDEFSFRLTRLSCSWEAPSLREIADNTAYIQMCAPCEHVMHTVYSALWIVFATRQVKLLYIISITVVNYENRKIRKWWWCGFSPRVSRTLSTSMRLLGKLNILYI